MSATANQELAELHHANAELQRTNAGLQKERDAALAELQAASSVARAQRDTEYGERIEYQDATINVLKAISASPGDPQPVFELIVRHAAELRNVLSAGLFEYDGELVHIRSSYRVEAISASGSLVAYSQRFPMRPMRGSITCRAILDGQIVHIRNLEADPQLASFVRELGHRSQVSVPLIRDGLAIGAISIAAKEPGGFADSQVALLQTFAEQAVIAIDSADTYRALQACTADLRETQEHQTATNDVLKVISRSGAELEAVLDTLVQTAARLCDAQMAFIHRREGGVYRPAAVLGFPIEFTTYLKAHPLVPGRGSIAGRVAMEGRAIHISDVAADPEYVLSQSIVMANQRTALGVPLLRENELIGVIVLARQRVQPFTDKEIELVSTFADQAVIAIENARLITETREALEQQTATAEVLQVLNVSPGDLGLVFDIMLRKALTLCGAAFGQLLTFDGVVFRAAAWCGYEPGPSGTGTTPAPGMALYQLVHGEQIVHIPDITADDVYRSGNPVRRRLADDYGGRTAIWIALRKDEELLGAFVIYRTEVRPFSDKQITLLQNFAAQAVVAMENARLMNEQREALEQQTATAEVLRVINASPGDLAPVFEAILDKAMRLCGAAFGCLWTYDGEHVHAVALRGAPSAFAEFLTRAPHSVGPDNAHGRLLRGEQVVHIADVTDDEAYRSGDPVRRALVALSGGRTLLAVPLRKDGAFLGDFVIYRTEVRPFSDKQISLLQSFADQAVVAMENARLLNEVRQRQVELRITFENMGDGVALFDESSLLVAWNHKFQEMFALPDLLLEQRGSYEQLLRFLAARGDYGTQPDVEALIHRLTMTTDRPDVYERERPNGHILEIRRNPVPSGGFVLIFSDITARKRNEAEVRAARDAAEAAYRKLKATQASLIQAEKMASLGQLTAGIAHEIKNPLNFVNNFASLSVDLLDELKQTAAPGFEALDEARRAEVDDLTSTLASNLAKINEHGRRADGIVRSMLEHSRGRSGDRRSVDLNTLVDEALNLAYHGARAQDQSFSIKLQREFEEAIAPIVLAPQDITRVLLNLLSNGFYATRERQRTMVASSFEPTLKVSTHGLYDAVEIRVRDNGIGIPPEIKDRLFQPFFTTKPTGEGTGLGLSMSYDIITQQHGGSISVESEVREYSEFTVRLPRNP
jgi:GAF domain-containing protein